MHRRRLFPAARLAALTVFLFGVTVATAPASSADPGCVDGGVLSIFARGSQGNLDFNTAESGAFYSAVEQQLGGLPFSQVDLGNIDGDNTLEAGEYPAIGVWDWEVHNGFAGYYRSMDTGWQEMSAYLEERSARCPDEIYLIGGYSQGAEVVGYAMSALSDRARSQIGFVALFGDPRFNPGCVWGQQDAAWVRGSATCRGGSLGAKDPYVPAGIADRFASWCDSEDGICNADLAHAVTPITAHDNYPDRWIPEAAAEAAPILRARLGWAPLPEF